MIAMFDFIHDLPTLLEGLRVVKSSLNKDDVFLLMGIECTDDPIDNKGPLTLFQLGISLHFCMKTALGRSGD